jgi:cyclase
MKKIPLVLLHVVVSFTTPPTATKHFKILQLKPGVWAAIQNDNYGHAICNAGIVDLGGKTVVFDPFMTPGAARELKKTAEELTGRKVTLVINSHFHNDHIRGNQVFAQQARIISTGWTRDKIFISEKEEQAWEKKNVPARITAEKQKLITTTGWQQQETIMWVGYYEGIAHSLPELKITVPDLTFSDSLWIYGSKRKIKLVECKNGHTNSDVIMQLPDDNIVFMGDLFFVDRHPWLGDGDAASWQNHIHQLRTDTAYNIYIPGHGPAAGKDEMKLMENYLTDLPLLVKKAIDQHLPDSLIIQQPIPADYRLWWYSRFYVPNLLFLCEQLRKK